MTIPLIVLASLSLFFFYSFNPFNPEKGWIPQAVEKPASVVPPLQQRIWDAMDVEVITVKDRAALASGKLDVRTYVPQPGDVISHTTPYQIALDEAHYPGLELSLSMALLGILVAFVIYHWKKIDAGKLKQAITPVYTFLSNKWYFDELYDATVVGGTIILSKVLRWFDNNIIDGIVNGSAALTRGGSSLSGWFDNHVVDGLVNFSAWFTGILGRGARKVQTGRVQTYIIFVLLGVLIIFFAFRGF
jgi:NADH-quinone oxidoreductase subunit L